MNFVARVIDKASNTPIIIGIILALIIFGIVLIIFSISYCKSGAIVGVLAAAAFVAGVSIYVWNRALSDRAMKKLALGILTHK